MKFWKALLLALSVLLIILTASHIQRCSTPTLEQSSRFYVVDKQDDSLLDGHFFEVIDHETGVHYLFASTNRGAGFTPMYNSDGSIKVEEVK